MASGRRSLSSVLPPAVRNSHVPIIIVVLLLASVSAAQQAPPVNQAQNPNSPIVANAAAHGADARLTIPAGTRLALVLTHPVDSKTMRRGDEIYAQTTSPVIVGDQLVIPSGTFVQGTIAKIARSGSRGEFSMQSLSVVYPTGYAARISGPTNIESDEGTALRNPGGGAKTGAILAPLIGVGAGTAIGAAAHTTNTTSFAGQTMTTATPKGMAIGSITGLAAGGVVSMVLLLRSHQFYVESGSPMEMTLQQPVSVSKSQIAEAIKGAPVQPPTVVVRQPVYVPTPTSHGTCTTPGTPGTPPTVIPGTPPVGNSPGTPPTVIPGTPGTPGTSYPCP